ncbi:hypothetical protein OG884_17305 [Streptosporangium sp. NBC_01755]|uniref:hypothetical protein n=1 Tax=Streptosporangium sp. NBC_01755 TaxID=2975949 RepID=UPI002DD88CB3|nr:hypothetical protein [Streptosporangium sp. NBC_01755]WSD03572.1 hypothetical protein OG884_17305 [Streptosporangium sp. NBC_01755]
MTLAGPATPTSSGCVDLTGSMVALQPVCAATPAGLAGYVYSAIPAGLGGHVYSAAPVNLAGSICTTGAMSLVSSYEAVGCV